MYARLLNSIIPKYRNSEHKITLFPPHDDPNRFRGTEIELKNGERAQVQSTNGTETTIVLKSGGKKITRVLNEPAKILRLVDNSLIQTRRVEERHRSRSPIARVSQELRRKNIEHSIKGDRIYFVMGYYFIEVSEDTADLNSGKRGHLKTYPTSEKGLLALAERAKKIDNNFDPSKIPV